MALGTRAISADVVRAKSGSAIGHIYSSLGSPLTKPWRIMLIKNTTSKTVFISEDGSNDHYEIPGGTSDTFDFQANARAGDHCHKKVGTQFYVRGVSGDLPQSGKIILQGQYT
jgi:hypothetical protein